jgi:hypothetical protein
LAINSYQRVANPISTKISGSKGKFRKHVVAIWLTAISLSVIQLFIYRCQSVITVQKKLKFNSTNYCYCHETWGDDPEIFALYYSSYTVWIFLQTYLIPAVILITMYLKMILKLRQRNLVTANSKSNSQNSQTTTKVTNKDRLHFSII